MPAPPTPDTPAATRRWRLPALRLSGRFVLVSLALLLLVQAAGFLVIDQGIHRNAHQQLAEQLALSHRVWQRLLEQRASKLTQGAEVVAADYGIREAVGTDDQETMRSALANHGLRIGATLAALLDPAGRVRAVGEGADPALAAVLQRLAPQLAERQRTLRGEPRAGGAASAEGRHGAAQATASVVDLVGRTPYQFVMVPMGPRGALGQVVMGFPLDQALVDDLHAVSGMHAALVAQPMHEAPRLLMHSFRGTADPAPLATELADGDLQLGRSAHMVASQSVASGSEGRVLLRVAGDIAEATAPYRRLQWMLGGITAAGLLLFGLGSLWSARRVTEPLRRLVSASERLGRGDYDAPLEMTEGGDEIGELARAFDHMRVNVAAQRDEIRDLAYRDRLTGLPNRLCFRDETQLAIGDAAAAGWSHLAVLMLDLDRFKHVNDVLGYASGDRLLARVAERLRQAVGEGTLVARLGGDEFAVLLPGADASLAMQAAQHIGQAFEQPLLLDDQTVDLSAGIGLAIWPEHASDADTLLSRAEVAMYAAKRRTAAAQVYDPSVDTSSALTLSLLSELKRAVECNELRLFLQPKIAIATGALCGAEALVRWQHPTRGMVPPMQFIPFAEQTGFIRQLTLWIFDQAAAEQVMLAVLGVRRVSVNLSTRDLLDQELPEKLDAILRRHRAVPEGFCLEITESAIMDDPQRAEATLNRLAQRGYKLSIDDFGTGYSSLAYLKRLPVNELKIDKSFVMAMEQDAGDAKIVRSTIDLAHNLGLTVVAEGVENAAVLSLLHALQCDEGQGYHMSKPLPMREFSDWAARWQARPPALAASPSTMNPRSGEPLLH